MNPENDQLIIHSFATLCSTPQEVYQICWLLQLSPLQELASTRAMKYAFARSDMIHIVGKPTISDKNHYSTSSGFTLFCVFGISRNPESTWVHSYRLPVPIGYIPKAILSTWSGSAPFPLSFVYLGFLPLHIPKGCLLVLAMASSLVSLGDDILRATGLGTHHEVLSIAEEVLVDMLETLSLLWFEKGQ